MKLDKQEMAVIGVIGLIVITMIFYAVAVFGGGKEETKKDQFKAPKIVKNEVKDNYNKRLNKALRNEPRKPKDPVLLNPFSISNNGSSKTDSLETEQSPFKTNNKSTVLVEKHKRKEDTYSAPAPSVEITRQVSKKDYSKPVPDKEFEPILAGREPRTKKRYEDNPNDPLNTVNKDKTYQASVYGEQKIYNNSLLKIRLLTPITLESGIVIPRNTFVSGEVSFSNQRVKIIIKSIPYKNVIHSVNYTVYDANDGLSGIYVSGGELNDINDKAASTMTDNAVTVGNMRILQNVGQEVKKWSRKKSVTILDEHRLFLK